MPLQSFSFLNPESTEVVYKNQRVLSENSKTIVRNDLTVVTPVNTPVVNFGYFTLYGPIVFYVIKVTLNNGDGWTANTSYINLPYEVLVASGALQAGSMGSGFNTLGTVRSGFHFADATNPKRLHPATSYTNATGADEIIHIQGWYFRN